MKLVWAKNIQPCPLRQKFGLSGLEKLTPANSTWKALTGDLRFGAVGKIFENPCIMDKARCRSNTFGLRASSSRPSKTLKPPH